MFGSEHPDVAQAIEKEIRARLLNVVTPASEEAAVAEGDEVGLFPPVSGGSGADERLVLTAEPLDPGALTGLVRSDGQQRAQ